MGDFIGTSRAPQIEAKVSKQLLVFTAPEGISSLGKKITDYDDFLVGNNLVQVAAAYDSTNGDALWYRVADLTDGFTVTTDWTKLTTALTDISCVVADGGTIFYSNATSVYRRNFDTTWTPEYWQFETANIISLAYENNGLDSVLYVYRYVLDLIYYYTFGLVDLYYVYSGASYITTWKGHIPFAGGSNVRMGTAGKIVYLQNSYTSSSPYFFEFDAIHSGPTRKVIALDDLDDLETFALSGVTKVPNGSGYETILSGVVTRKNGGQMLVYMIGSKEFTTGLNYYIADALTNDIRGNMQICNGRLWFTGPDHVYYAEGSKYLASGTRTTTPVTGINSAQMSLSTSTPYSLNMLCKTENYDNIDAGDELEVSLTEGGTTYDMPFVVDGIRKVITESDVSCQIQATSRWMKMMNDWTSDSYYDYWSQTKSSGNPKDLTKMVRFSGLWSEYMGALKLDDLNEDGVLYLTDKASQDYSMRARFVRKSGDFNAQFGIVINFQKETIADAATRLGKESAEVTDDETIKSGIFIIHDEAFNSGSGGFRVYSYTSIYDNPYMQIGADLPFPLARDTYFQVMATFTNGYLTIYTFNESTSTWTNIGEMNGIIPGITGQWNYDYGRAGIYMKNVTVTGTYYPFSSESLVLPVADNSSFPTSDTVLVDEEQIAYSGKSANISYPNLFYRYGKTMASFTNITGSSQSLGYTKTYAAFRQRASFSGTVYVKAVKLWVQKIGNPLDGISVEIVNPSTTYGFMGQRKASVVVPPNQIPSEGGWVTVKFGTGVRMSSSDNIQILKTRYASTGFVSTTDYFNFKNTTGYTYAASYLNDNDDKWHGLSGSLAFELIAYTDAEPSSPSVCVAHNAGLSGTDGYYNGEAIIVTSGPGTQTVAKITNYKHDTDVCTFYTDIDINAYLDETTVLAVVPCLTGLTRGELPAAHMGGKIDIYRAGPMALSDSYAYFSEEMDMSLEDVVRKISRHAGVLNFVPKRLLDATIRPNANSETFNRRSFIVDAYFGGNIHPADSINFHFRATASTSGVYFVLNGDECTLYNSDGSLNAKIPGIGSRLDILSHFRFSLFDGYLSVWDGDKHFHTFILDDTDAATENDLFYVDGTSDVDLQIVIPDGFMRIDNFVLDMGKQGLALVQQIIGNKHFYLQDNGEELNFFRTRDEINDLGALYDRASSGTIGKAEPPFTRICVEGGEVIEQYDTANLASTAMCFSGRRLKRSTPWMTPRNSPAFYFPMPETPPSRLPLPARSGPSFSLGIWSGSGCRAARRKSSPTQSLTTSALGSDRPSST